MKKTVETKSPIRFNLTKREFLKTNLYVGFAAFLGSTGFYPKRTLGSSNPLKNFSFVQSNTLDTVTVPKEYTWQVVSLWGQPMFSKAKEFDHKTTGNAENQKLCVGDNNDGMAFFEKENRKLLVINNEYCNLSIMHHYNDGILTSDDITKNMFAHGITIIEVEETNGKWVLKKDSAYNRRITPETEMDIKGPAAGHDLLKTSYDSTGTKALGTWNNCGNGQTPWGSYLSCEENFNKYFSCSDKEQKLSVEQKRYGIKTKDAGYQWSKIHDRFDISKEPNEPNKVGYVVEIDPFNPLSTPKKRTALGRFKHENAELVLANDNRIVVYMGDDQRGEFLYKFISKNSYDSDKNADDLLDNGSLFVAKFENDGTGFWVELKPSNTGFNTKEEICIFTRLAASTVGATPMDRPEWVATNPLNTDVYVALTNNKNRGIKKNAGGDPMKVGGPNPREQNIYGQIIKIRPDLENHSSQTFRWEIFAMAGNPTVNQGSARRGSPNINAENIFNCPDGLKVSHNGFIWIQTDGNYSNSGDFKGMGNNQMLVANPETKEIRRFLVGPKECEVTGFAWSSDKKTMFVGIQHPGERGNSSFPEGKKDALPRSAVIAIKHKDNLEIG